MVEHNRLIDDWPVGDLNALVKNLGKENARDISKNPVAVERRGNKVVIQIKPKPEPIVSLIDRNGFHLPPGSRYSHQVVRRDDNFRLEMPRHHWAITSMAKRLSSIEQGLDCKGFISFEKFRTGIQTARDKVRSHRPTANILSGPCLPFAIPKMNVVYDLTMRKIILPAIASSYEQQFPGKKFETAWPDDIQICDERHYELINILASGPVVGLYFPICMQGWCLEDARSQSRHLLPAHFRLAGALETGVSMITYPDILATGEYSPALIMGALRCASFRAPTLFAHHNGMYVGRTANITEGMPGASCGLVVVE